MKFADVPPRIRLLLAAMAAGSFSVSVLLTVVGLQVFAITSRELDLGLLGVAEFVPILILSPFTGTLADKFDRRKVYGAGLLIDSVAAGLLLIYAATSPTSVGPILLIVALYGVGRAVGTPAGRALPIDLAPQESIERIVALRSLTFQMALIIGPIVGAFANKASHVLPYAIVIGAQVLAMVLLSRVPASGTDQLSTASGPRQALTDAFEGLRFIRKTPVVLGAITLDLFAVLFGGAVALLPAIVEKRLDISDVDLGVGVLRAAIAAGAALTALALSIRPLRRRTGRTLFLVVGVFGLATIALGVTRSYLVAAAAVIVLSAADQISVFIRSNLVPLATPEAMRGRVLAVENIFIGGSNELGAFESGATAALFGLGPAIVIGGVGTLVVLGIAWFGFPALRETDRFSDVIPPNASQVRSSV